MGDKAEARATVIKAGVPVVPGTEDVGNMTNEELLAKAPQIGFPLLIKATAGGGGKGMREVKSLEEMPTLLQSARREAESAFGDGNVYLEKLVAGARHIEFQIMADTHGNVVHLGERECSLQRRHQKLLEEALSSAMDDDLRLGAGRVRHGVVPGSADHHHVARSDAAVPLQAEATGRRAGGGSLSDIVELAELVDLLPDQVRRRRGIGHRRSRPA